METLTRTEALVGVAMCAAYADGAMGADEDERLTDQLHACRALRDCDDAALRAAIQKVERIARQDGDAALLARAAEALPADLRATAFCVGVDLVLADGDIAAEERGFIDRLRRALGVDEPLASRIVDVVLIRNRG